MRVLMTSVPVEAHLNGMIPLAWALRAAGHEVHVAAQPALTEAITAAGLTAVPVGSDDPHDELLRDLGAELTSFYGGIDFTGERDDGLEEAKGADLVLTSTFYAQVNDDPTIDGMVAHAREWRPELVLWEPYTFAGPVTARVVGAAQAKVLWGPDLFGARRARFLRQMAAHPPERYDDVLAEWLGWTLDRYGHAFDEEIVSGQVAVDQMPEGVRIPGDRPTLPMRYVPYNGRSVIPDWLRAPPPSRRVCLTLGITARAGAYRDPMPVRDVLDAVADLDVELVVTLSPEQRAELGPVPEHVRVVDFVPLAALLPTCAAVVHHGGAGTWSTAVAAGTPQLVVAGMWDNVHRARCLERLGAGRFLPPAELTPDTLRDTLQELLDKPAHAEGAARLRARVLAEPSPAEVVPQLEQLAAENRS